MAKTDGQVWTLRSVARSDADGWAFVVVQVTWHSVKDTFSYEVDGIRYEWHRRGMPMFQTRSAACEYVKDHGWPLG